MIVFDKKDVIKNELYEKLVSLALKGPVPTISQGAPAVGMTLLHELGIKYDSRRKANYKGIVVTGFRRNSSGFSNRVNLFAQVPDWELSACKSSREIVKKYGYEVNPCVRRLYCTITASSVNPQGLKIIVDREKDVIYEVAYRNGTNDQVATWKLSTLRQRLVESHPETFWVKAKSFFVDGKEYLHYREVIYTGAPIINEFIELISLGTITVDHLISMKNDKVNEKGPLFKIQSSCLSLLFPPPENYSLLV